MKGGGEGVITQRRESGICMKENKKRGDWGTGLGKWGFTETLVGDTCMTVLPKHLNILLKIRIAKIVALNHFQPSEIMVLQVANRHYHPTKPIITFMDFA